MIKKMNKLREARKVQAQRDYEELTRRITKVESQIKVIRAILKIEEEEE